MSVSYREDRMMTVNDVAEMLQKSASWVYKECARGRLPVRHIGASVRFDRAEIDAYIHGEWQPPRKVAQLRRGGRSCPAYSCGTPRLAR